MPRIEKPYNSVVLIGRFQPLHNAHLEIIKRCTALADHLVIIVGSANQPRTYKNPFTFEERSRMIRAATAGLVLTFTLKLISILSTTIKPGPFVCRVL